VPRTWLAAQLALRTGLEPVMPLAGTVIPVSSDGITIPQTWYGLAWKRSSGANTRAVRMLMANLHVSLEDALKLLEIPKSERNTYRKICAARAGQKKSPEIG
ncbi:MAG TPA: hypothetical protein IAC31_02490, partial [Candidatus Faecousia intestinigallinarum]|nr:hypothetical protein [Candidatus Faecousia intestinigallinarum]